MLGKNSALTAGYAGGGVDGENIDWIVEFRGLDFWEKFGLQNVADETVASGADSRLLLRAEVFILVHTRCLFGFEDAIASSSFPQFTMPTAMPLA